MDKHELKYDRPIRLDGKRLLTNGKNIYIYDLNLNTIETPSNLYQMSLWVNPLIYHIPKGHVLLHMINEDVIILSNDRYVSRQYKIFNIKFSQIIKNITSSHNGMIMCSSDKYIIFRNDQRVNKISIFSIEKMDFVQDINESFTKISIVDDILYISSYDTMTIYKYNIKGEKIGTLIFWKDPRHHNITDSKKLYKSSQTK
jgi:hypothetical protein